MMHVSGSGETTCSSIRAPALPRSVMLNSLTDFNLALAKQNVVSSCNYSLMKDVTIEFQKELIGFRPTDVVYIYQMLNFQ